MLLNERSIINNSNLTVAIFHTKLIKILILCKDWSRINRNITLICMGDISTIKISKIKYFMCENLKKKIKSFVQIICDVQPLLPPPTINVKPLIWLFVLLCHTHMSKNISKFMNLRMEIELNLWFFTMKQKCFYIKIKLWLLWKCVNDLLV